MVEVFFHSHQAKKIIADNQRLTFVPMFEAFSHSRQTKKLTADNQLFTKVSMFEAFSFKPIFFTFSTCLANF